MEKSIGYIKIDMIKILFLRLIMYFSIFAICCVVYGKIATLELRNQTIYNLQLNITKQPVYTTNANVILV